MHLALSMVLIKTDKRIHAMKNIEIFDGQRAQTYDSTINVWFDQYDTLIHLLKSVINTKLAEPKSYRILILGSGTGNELLQLATAFPQSEFVGVDPSAQMNEIAKEKTKGLTNVQIVEGTIDNLEGKFDAITSILVTQFFETATKKQIIRSIYEKLNRGGFLIHADAFGNSNQVNTNFEIYNSFLQFKHDFEGLKQGLDQVKNSLNYVDESRMEFLFKEAGFSSVTKFFQWLIFAAWLIEK